MYQEQIDRILKKVSILDLKLDPVISKTTLLEIEKKLNIKLPESYINYLTKIQNGGFSDTLHKNGPYYGIYSIDKSVSENSEWEIDLNKEFLLTEDLNFGDFYNGEENYEKHCWRYENDIEYQKNIQQVLEKYQDTNLLSGTLPICEYGCGDFFRLVVNGSNAGEIWADCGIINGTGFYSLNIDILTFYENWLDRRIEVKKDPTRALINAYNPTLEFGNNEKYKIIDQQGSQ
ncbi:SMI1/KNR4 family protein [Pedobacter caeni]|uniref:SMI1 / KNR4 family (SUKH-1) n=1 Tax=Pedobacter caeni TaxID=288992 RepID=A0A1M4UH73_9SPHI|nr:SMI1/KNR4 family protein [Pedobacter caeni]SHE56025.1 SMI1 / KNR4 family (SUKH-1) [Pedobacter caeni]